MLSISFPASVRLLASAAVAGALSMQPVSSFAQSAPTSTSCTLPVLDLANPSPGDMLLPGAYTIQGVALDPQAQQGSGVDQVSFFLGDRNAGGIPLGSAQPGNGPRADDFSVTVTLPTTIIGERDFVAYARSAVTGKETRVSLPIVLGEDPSKAGVTPAAGAESSTNPSSCEASSTAAAAPVVTMPGPVPAPSVAAPSAAPSANGIAAAQAYAASVELQVPDSQNGTGQSGEEQLQQ